MAHPPHRLSQAQMRFKRTICPSCGAPKQRPSATGYVYCDYCGSLADYDFAKACEKPLARPGPVYERLLAEVSPAIASAVASRDLAALRAVQVKLFDAYVEACPDAVPLRVKDPDYRKRFVAFSAEQAVVSALDAEAKSHEAKVAAATRKLSFAEVQPGVVRVAAQAFAALMDAVLDQVRYVSKLHEERGVYALHPDRASPELLTRVGLSMFAQGWLPMLDEAGAKALLERTRLGGEYVEADPPASDQAACGGCGAAVGVLVGARRMVCEHCGRKLDVEGDRVRCPGCGATLAPDEAASSFACPHCRTNVARVAMMQPS